MTTDADDHLLKIVIPETEGRTAPQYLFSMGVSRTSLFPALMGTLSHWLSGILPSIRSTGSGAYDRRQGSGMPCFEGLGTRTSECAIVYYAFDLLYFDGHDFTKAPLISRKAALKKILPRRNTGRVRYTAHIVGEGERLFQELEKKQLEGMVAKRADSLYVGGRTRARLKIKTDAGRDEMRKRSEAWGP
jgi:hypothetical protein